jgi:hypothetical protein
MAAPRTHEITARLLGWSGRNQFARNRPVPELARPGAARHEG